MAPIQPRRQCAGSPCRRLPPVASRRPRRAAAAAAARPPPATRGSSKEGRQEGRRRRRQEGGRQPHEPAQAGRTVPAGAPRWQLPLLCREALLTGPARGLAGQPEACSQCRAAAPGQVLGQALPLRWHEGGLALALRPESSAPLAQLPRRLTSPHRRGLRRHRPAVACLPHKLPPSQSDCSAPPPHTAADPRHHAEPAAGGVALPQDGQVGGMRVAVCVCVCVCVCARARARVAI